MLRAEEGFEFKDPGLQALWPHARQYHVVEQVFELPLWKAQVLPMSAPGVHSDERLWRRYISSSMRGLLGIVLHPDWERARIHVILPSYLMPEGEMQLARCTAIWEATCANDSIEPTWIFETNRGTFADPELGFTLEGLRKGALRWKDFETDLDTDGRVKI
ncbi:MAG: hypothetical protein EOP81_14965 [Variovorax sp.]|nr:MAG: hypothetical protein EOP81_14965 [Variovorax sp.]